jgi:hypothetical protein
MQASAPVIPMAIVNEVASDSIIKIASTKEEEKKSELVTPPLPEAYKITNWDEVQLHTMKLRKIKHMMLHPYARKSDGDISKMIEVEIEGEIKNGVPNGQCFLWFIYKGELKPGYEPPSLPASPSSPYLDG